MQTTLYSQFLALAFLLLTLSGANAQTVKELYNLAGEAAKKGDYAASSGFFLKIIETEGPDADLFYYTACSYAMARQPEEAFSYLNKALSLGFARVQLMEDDTDLISLREDRRWHSALENCKRNFRTFQQMYETPTLETPYQENLSDEQKIAGLSKFWMQTKFSFANFDLNPGLDWDSLYLAFLPRVQQTKTSLEYYYELAEMCAHLKDAHSNIFPPQELMNHIFGNVPVITRLIEGKVLVEEVKDPTLYNQGLRKGQEVISVNNMPVADYVARYVLPYQSASTPQNMEILAYHHYFLAGEAGKAVSIGINDAQGKQREFSLMRIPLNDYWKLPNAHPAFEFKMLPGNVAYIALNNFFDNTAANEFINNLESIRKAEAIVLDVRENSGGDGSVGFNILEHLISEPVLSSHWRTPKFVPAFKAWGRTLSPHAEDGSLLMPIKQPLTQPVALLVSAKTFSAAEDFAVAFRTAKRGLIIGEPTSGSTGQPHFFTLPGGFRARVCAKREMYANGQEFIGLGVQPDVLLKPTVAAFRKDNDEVLEAALSSLNRTKAK